MQNFLLDTQEKFKYSNWFSLKPGERRVAGRVGKSLLRANLLRPYPSERKGI